MKYITVSKRGDGFGAQYQHIIFAILYSDQNNCVYAHTLIESMEHNYDNDPDFLANIENIMNIKNNYINVKDIDTSKNTIVIITPHPHLYPYIEHRIDICLNSESLKKIKTIFWANKERHFYKNNNINIAVHIRRTNQHDGQNARPETSDLYYINIINKIRNKIRNIYSDKKLLFHIYSQGVRENFKLYESEDTIFHLNEELCSTFTGLVAADILITSASSLSYVAAILSDGIIYYKPFWHPPASKWIVCN